jgi:hypothetical protein
MVLELKRQNEMLVNEAKRVDPFWPQDIQTDIARIAPVVANHSRTVIAPTYPSQAT